MSNVDAILTRGRAAAEALMRTRFATWIPDGTTRGADEMTVQAYTAGNPVTGRVQNRQRDAATEYVQVGQTRRPVLREGLHIPITADLPTAGATGVGWEYECIGLSPVDDPNLLGRRFRVVSVPMKSDATARRLDVVEV